MDVTVGVCCEPRLAAQTSIGLGRGPPATWSLSMPESWLRLGRRARRSLKPKSSRTCRFRVTSDTASRWPPSNVIRPIRHTLAVALARDVVRTPDGAGPSGRTRRTPAAFVLGPLAPCLRTAMGVPHVRCEPLAFACLVCPCAPREEGHRKQSGGIAQWT